MYDMDFFQQPRSARRASTAPPAKRRKIVSTIDHVTYDPAARQEYLSGFRKRKQQRIKEAQKLAKEKDRLQKIEDRRAVSDIALAEQDSAKRSSRFGSNVKMTWKTMSRRSMTW